MRDSTSNIQRTTSATQALIVCGVSFSFSCLAFAVSLLFLIPLTGYLHEQLGLNPLLTQATVLFELFGLPILAALWGIFVCCKAS